MRIDKYLCNAGKGSRKEVKQFLKDGRVLVNGKTVKNPDFKVNEESDEVIFSGSRVSYKKFIYLMMNKPTGYISASEDKKLPTVSELVPKEFSHYNVFCAGRLDIDTTGLLILTNDGAFAHRLTSPKHHVDKKYFAKINMPVTESDTEKMKNGVVLDDGYKCMEAKLEILRSCKNGSEIYLTIHEGKFHQVKRMFEALGKKVVSLKRVSIGGVFLDNELEDGCVRELTENELSLIFCNKNTQI